MAAAVIALSRPTQSSAEAWMVASDLPGRARIRCSTLHTSALLRQHCRVVLSSCHWLHHFRINGLAGSVCLDYPGHRRHELLQLLEDALTMSVAVDQLRTDPQRWFARRSVQRTTLHGAACCALLWLEVPLGLGSLGMGLLVSALLWPQIRSVTRKLGQRRITAETLELSFSAVLISQGLAGEAVLDLAFTDATEVAQSAIEPSEFKLDADHLLDRLGSDIVVQLVNDDGSLSKQPLDAVDVGMTLQLNTREHCFLSAEIVDGEVMVINRLYNGDWRPQRLSVGDTVQVGAFVISGEARATIIHCLHTDEAYNLLRNHHESLELEESAIETWLSRYKAVMPPLLLAAGGALLFSGSPERAISAFQFDPINDWENSNLSSRLTAIADLKLHNLNVRNPDCLYSLGKIKHLVISRSCLDRLAGIRLREEMEEASTLPHGTLIQLLAGAQHWFCGGNATPIWSAQLQRVTEPIAIETMTIGELRSGWDAIDREGRSWRLQQRHQSADAPVRHHLDPLDIDLDGVRVGTVTLLSEADEHWVQVCQELRELGITLHLVSSDERERLVEIDEQLGIAAANSHGPCTALERLELVRSLQHKGEGVAYVGYVLPDLPALSQADVSIGVDTDDDSRYTAKICDLTLPPNALWLSRLVRISQQLQRKRNQNFSLLGGTQLLSSLATAAGLIAPLETVLLGDIPLLLAELNNLFALRDQPGLRRRPTATERR